MPLYMGDLASEWNTEEENDEEAYLDDAEAEHGMELWTLANIFETPALEEDFDTKYSDVSVLVVSNWKVVKFEIGRYDAKHQYWRAGIDMYAVVR